MDWYDKKIAQEQFHFFAEGIINTSFSQRELYTREIDLYKYWRDVCKNNNYIYSTCLECKVNNILDEFYRTRLQINEKEETDSKVIHMIPDKVEEQKIAVGLEYQLN
ncbi:hypothetical protein JXA48_00915 [Candidatus Woesearchaeota archaeon]|nr:hypothetical protein [Candidatus Woesearchaeota archaeon]